MSADTPDDAPAPGRLSSVFYVYDVAQQGDAIVYYGEPLVDRQSLFDAAFPLFREQGYEVHVESRPGETALVAEPAAADDAGGGFPWTNVALAALTVLSTLYVGTEWYHVANPLSLDALRALPFSLAVMGVLGVHETGHYLLSRYHDVDASLPYFIPLPFTAIGTMGAVIRMKGLMPDRESLFDIGVAGPLLGLVATVVVTAIGLSLPPISQPPVSGGTAVAFNYPPLLRLIAWALGRPLSYGPGEAVSPVVFGGWVGMFVTLLNLIPVGQLDGGHVLRAVVGPDYDRVAPLVPAALFALAAYDYLALSATMAAFTWGMWGLIAAFFAVRGTVTPVDDVPVSRGRVAVAVLTLVLGALCFTPVPFQIAG